MQLCFGCGRCATVPHVASKMRLACLFVSAQAQPPDCEKYTSSGFKNQNIDDACAEVESTYTGSIAKGNVQGSNMADMYVRYHSSNTLTFGMMAFKSAPTNGNHLTVHIECNEASCTAGAGCSSSSCNSNGGCSNVVNCGGSCTHRPMDGDKKWDSNANSGLNFVTYCGASQPSPSPPPPLWESCGTAACNQAVWETLPNGDGACGSQIMWVFGGGDGSASWDQYENDLQASCNFVAVQASTANDCWPCAYAVFKIPIFGATQLKICDVCIK